jgi:disulfide bond formation protein DsbB
MSGRLKAWVGENRQWLPYLVWAVVFGSMVGSLVLSELMHLVPCVLCWWQRILMYPLVVIVGVGILRRDESWTYTALPLAAVGAVVALYHSLLQWGVIPEEIAPCNAVVSCVSKQIDWFGFVTIPFMSLLAFATVCVVTVIYMRSRPR